MPPPTISEITTAIQRVREDPENLTSADARLLLATFRASADDACAAEFEDLEDAWLDATDADDLQQDVVLALSDLPPVVAQSIAAEAIPLLAECLQSDDQFYELAHAIVCLCFAGQQSETDCNAPLAQAALQAICNNKHIWELDATFPDCLRKHGLPHTRSQVQALLQN